MTQQGAHSASQSQDAPSRTAHSAHSRTPSKHSVLTVESQGGAGPGYKDIIDFPPSPGDRMLREQKLKLADRDKKKKNKREQGQKMQQQEQQKMIAAANTSFNTQVSKSSTEPTDLEMQAVHTHSV